MRAHACGTRPGSGLLVHWLREGAPYRDGGHLESLHGLGLALFFPQAIRPNR